MVDSKFFGVPFGSSGDRTTIPEASQPSGAVSYAQGFGPDYERDPDTDPLAKRVPRDETNEYVYQLSNSIKFLQLYGLPEWYAVDGLGNPVTYPLAARVRYDAGGGMQAWVSIVATNTATPGSDATKWALDEVFSLPVLEATQAEANTGLIGTKIMTPRRTASAVQRGAWNFGVCTGTGDAMAVTLSPAPAAYTDGMTISVVPPGLNTISAPTINVNGLGVVPIGTAGGGPLNANDLSGLATLEYRSGVFCMVGLFIGTELRRGGVELATTAELAAGTDLTRVPSVARIAAQAQNGSWSFAVSGGSPNAITASLIPAPAALTAGMEIYLFVGSPNTGSATLNLNGLGAKNIVYADGNSVVANDVFASCFLIYDGTNWVVSNTRAASTTVRGVSRFATQAEMDAGTSGGLAGAPSTIARAIQSGEWLYCGPAGGTANALTATSVPNTGVISDGQVILLYIPTLNTGPATLNLNGTGAIPIVDGTGNALQANDLHGISTLIRVGSNWQLSSVTAASETLRGTPRFATTTELTAGTNLTIASSPGRIAPQVQSNSWGVANAGGTANTITATFTPAISALVAGMRLVVKISSINTGPATLNVNGLGAKDIVHKDGTTLQPNELVPGQMASVTYDGTNFQLDVSYGRFLSVQTFTASGTYTPTPGTAFARVRMVGGGGAGAGANIPASGQVTLGAPGGAGTYAEGKFSIAQIGASQVVTIGAGGASTLAGGGNTGGTTSLGSLITAPGGIGGLVLVNQVPPTINGNGAFSAVPSGANIVGFQGGGGTAAFAVTTAIGIGGVGAGGPFGSGGPGTGVNSNGFSASGFGAGGGGVCVNIGVGGGTRGGEGSPGYMIIEEYSL